MSFFKKSGIVNVKMVITEEKILSQIDKTQKLINPTSKKQIVKLEEDTYFRDLVESIKTYLMEYPQKNTFPADVYKAAYDLVEFATNQFEENTKKVEDLIREREKNIKLANVLSDVLRAVQSKAKNWKEILKKVKRKYPEDIVEALNLIGTTEANSEEYQVAERLIKAKIKNLESNSFIEIDMERIEDLSKALSYIGIEVAEALKYIPAPAQVLEPTVRNNQFEEIVKEETNTVSNKPTSELLQDIITENVSNNNTSNDDSNEDLDNFILDTRFETKPSLWQRIKNSKFIRTVKYIMQIKVVLDYPALPEGRGE